MSTQRDVLPLHERQAARAAIEQLVKKHGSQAAAGAAIGVSQNAINKALVYTQVGPSIIRLLLAHIELPSVEALLQRYGDPSAGPSAEAAEAPPKEPRSAREEAILTAIRFAPGATEKEVRAIADEYATLLAHAEPIEWLETLLREVQRRVLIPGRQQRDVARRERSTQRTMRKLHDAARAVPAAPAEAAPAKKPSVR